MQCKHEGAKDKGDQAATDRECGDVQYGTQWASGVQPSHGQRLLQVTGVVEERRWKGGGVGWLDYDGGQCRHKGLRRGQFSPAIA